MAADQGHGGAQHNLGVMHAQGLGMAQDLRQTAAWWRKAWETQQRCGTHARPVFCRHRGFQCM